MSDADVLGMAKALIETFGRAIANGYKHFDLDGHELRTTKGILVALQRDGEIQIKATVRTEETPSSTSTLVISFPTDPR